MTATLSPTAVAEFPVRLVAWQKNQGRHDLPWQNTRDPYRIWLSEIMLQQTQVSTVIPYYGRFLERFPDIGALAAAGEQDVLSLWSGLGYYARGRNLHKAAQRVATQFGGVFPRHRDDVASLPGIGRSTAAAIVAFAYGERAAILDGNVKRVLTRVFAIAGFPGEKQVESRLWGLAEKLLPAQDVAAYTQGLMDLGATLCTRTKPACGRCPMADICVARRDHRQAELPTRKAKKAMPQKFARVLVLLDGHQVILEQRPPTGIWGGLLGLPALPEALSDQDLPDWAARQLGCKIAKVETLAPVQHVFTHFRLELQPLLCTVSGHQVAAHQDKLRWIGPSELEQAPLPTPIRKILAALLAPSLL